MARNPVRHLVLDHEAAQALSSTRTGDQQRAEVVEAIVAANGRVVVPTAVWVEAGWRRRDHGAANANRLVGNDAPLDRSTRIELSSCDVWYPQRRWPTPRWRWPRSA